MSAYQKLIAFQRKTEALMQISGLVAWDQETFMPRGATTQRSEWLSAIEEVIHKRKIDPRIGEWIASLDENNLDETARACVRMIQRDFTRLNRLPVDLTAEIARVSSLAIRVWSEAREARDFSSFLPKLNEIISLKREEAAALANGMDHYSALLDRFEPDISTEQLATIFGAMKDRLISLRERILGTSKEIQKLDFAFSGDRQLKIARELASAFGYDWERGRLDLVTHPFSSGSGNDVRITTRVDERDPYNCLYSTIHETGHGGYEQSVEQGFLLTPVGEGASTGVHESQSRICENQIGRSRAFTSWLYARLQREFGDFGIGCANDFFANVNRVGKGYIRTEADEVQYNLHIMLRYEIERDLISGDLEVPEAEEAWNNRFRSYFGYSVDHSSNGILQDVHWAAALVGYFPTYSLGNIYAGCLHESMRRDLPELDRDLANGNPGPAVEWLRDNVRRFGALHGPRATIENACGFEVSPDPLLNYLDEKFAEIYNF